MVMTNEQATALIAAAQEAVSNGGEVPADLRCQYPSKRCDNVRTTKRGGGLHRLCSFHRARANKNQWLVDQRRRLRREREGSVSRRGSISDSPKTSPSEDTPECSIMMSLDVLDADAMCPPLGHEDLQILQALLFDEQEDYLSDLSDLSDNLSTDASLDWMI